MYLYEMTDNEKLIRIITAIDRLKNDLESGKITSNWTIDDLLKYFRKYDIVLSPNDLYNMVQKKPLKTVVTNIQGKDVIFKGMPQQPAAPEAPPPEQSKEVVAKMAQHAMPK